MPSHSKVVAAVVEFAEELFPGFVFDIFPTPCGFGVLPILVESVLTSFKFKFHFCWLSNFDMEREDRNVHLLVLIENSYNKVKEQISSQYFLLQSN